MARLLGFLVLLLGFAVKVGANASTKDDKNEDDQDDNANDNVGGTVTFGS